MLENLVLSWFILLLIVSPVVYPHLVLNHDLAEVSGGISKFPMIPRGNLLSTSENVSQFYPTVWPAGANIYML